MISYKILHKKAEEYLKRKLDHQIKLEYRKDHKKPAIFDVYDKKKDVAYEILTAKIIKSSHEHEEAILSKLFRYLIKCPRLKFYLVSYGEEEIELFHNLNLEHWHLFCDWEGNIEKEVYHKGKSALEIAKFIYKILISLAPLSEWIKEGRRKKHSSKEEFEKLTEKYKLPKNFLIGLWRDWHLDWVWKLEKALPKWEKLYIKDRKNGR